MPTAESQAQQPHKIEGRKQLIEELFRFSHHIALLNDAAHHVHNLGCHELVAHVFVQANDTVLQDTIPHF